LRPHSPTPIQSQRRQWNVCPKANNVFDSVPIETPVNEWIAELNCSAKSIHDNYGLEQ
jgi:hypothetical protein